MTTTLNNFIQNFDTRQAVLSLIVVFTAFIISRVWKMGSRLPQMPPGPPTLPSKLSFYPTQCQLIPVKSHWKFTSNSSYRFTSHVSWLSYEIKMHQTRTYNSLFEWSKEYGGIMSLSASLYNLCDMFVQLTTITAEFGTRNVIVLQDKEAIKDLLDKKSAIYSSRPDAYIAEGTSLDVSL